MGTTNLVFLGESALIFPFIKCICINELNKGPYVIVRHEREMLIPSEKAVLINGKQEFVITICTDGEVNDKEDFDEFLSKFNRRTIVEISVSTFEKIYRNLPDLLIISTCRDGLYKTYAPVLSTMRCSGMIVSFDNDKTIVEKTKGELPCFEVAAGMAHALAIKDTKEGCIKVEVGDHVLFVFPNKRIKKYFDFYMPTPELIFCSSEKEMHDYNEKKLLFINVPHSILTLTAYIYNGISLETSKKLYSEMVKRDEVLRDAIADSSAIQSTYSDRNGYAAEDVYDWQCLCIEFLIHTVNSDTVERGLKWNKSSLEKLDRHMEYIRILKSDRLEKTAYDLKQSILKSISEDE